VYFSIIKLSLFYHYLVKGIYMGSEKNRLMGIIKNNELWQEWGPYLPERQWGTVRECFASPEKAWEYTTFETAKKYNYLCGDDGIFGWSDRSGRLCFALSFWNGSDPFLKERFFGLNALEGNHAEDVKECYYYLDAVPSYAYAKALYRYPCESFPYEKLLSENQSRSCFDPEYELLDTGVLDNSQFFDIEVEYAKGSPKDIAIRITAWNRDNNPRPLHIIPQFWFRNTWQWSSLLGKIERKPQIYGGGASHIVFIDAHLGEYRLEVSAGEGETLPQLLFTENESGFVGCQDKDNPNSPSSRDAFTQHIIYNNSEYISKENKGTRVGVWYALPIEPHSKVSLQLRFSSISEIPPEPIGESCDALIEQRKQEADEFYQEILLPTINPPERDMLRQAYAGLLWSKIYYKLSVKEWLNVYNNLQKFTTHSSFNNWKHLNANDILSIPDKWEYPWFASWDIPFHLIPMFRIDPIFAIKQLQIFLSPKFQSPTGQIPSSEWNFSAINPPIMAWGVNKIIQKIGQMNFDIPREDLYSLFLIESFCSLYANLTWWANLKDKEGKTLFNKGLIGLDNFSILEKTSDNQKRNEESQSIFWTPFFIGNLVEIACKGALIFPYFEKIAIRLLHYFIKATEILQNNEPPYLWNETDSFFYPVFNIEGEKSQYPIRSFSGLVPLFGVARLPVYALPELSAEVEKLIKSKILTDSFYKRYKDSQTGNDSIFLSCITEQQRNALINYALNESEFLSPFGLRSLSRYHREKPIYIHTSRQRIEIKYCPGELESKMFGGNTNWFGPIWFPLNYLFLDSMDKWGSIYGDLKISVPCWKRNMTFKDIAQEIRQRLRNLFVPNSRGEIPSLGLSRYFKDNPLWNNYYLFFEYFNGDTGEGIGASHQTGWTALITEIIHELHKDT